MRRKAPGQSAAWVFWMSGGLRGFIVLGLRFKP